MTSLDRPVGDDGDTALGDLLPSEGTTPEEEVYLETRSTWSARSWPSCPTPIAA